MSRKSYFEKLRDPRWQRRRLEVLEKAGFACIWCADKQSTLHVHHTYYKKGADPWDYPDSALLSLCETCHGYAESVRADLNMSIGLVAFSPLHMCRLLGYVAAIISEIEVENEPKGGFIEVSSYEELIGIADFFGTTATEIEKHEGMVAYGLGYHDLAKMDPRRAKGREPNG